MVNAHFIQHVPGRKTDMLDSEWLAVLARFGLVRGSFIPTKGLHERRLVSRYRRKLNANCASQINRLHKMLDDAGIKLAAVVADNYSYRSPGGNGEFDAAQRSIGYIPAVLANASSWGCEQQKSLCIQRLFIVALTAASPSMQ